MSTPWHQYLRVVAKSLDKPFRGCCIVLEPRLEPVLASIPGIDTVFAAAVHSTSGLLQSRLTNPSDCAVSCWSQGWNLFGPGFSGQSLDSRN